MTHVDPLVAVGFAWIRWTLYRTVPLRRVNATKSSEGMLGRAQHLLPLVLGFIPIFGTRHLIRRLARFRREEAVLAQAFGPEYERFRREVPALLPFVY